MRGVPGVVTGVYRASAVSGLCAGLLQNDSVMSFCWEQALPYKAAILSLRLRAQIVVPFTAAQELAITANIARTFTVPDTGGVTLSVASGDNQKLHKQFQTSLLTDFRLSNNSALVAGTRTLDPGPFLSGFTAQLTAAASAVSAPISESYDLQNADRYPIILSPNEGFVVRNLSPLGAGGSVRFAIDVEWAEFTTNLS